MQTSQKNRTRTFGAILLVAVLAVAMVLGSLSLAGVGGGSGGSGGGRERSEEAASAEETRAREALLALARREAGDPYALGEPDAPVVLIEYSDFQCPFCGTFARDTKPELVERYVAEGVLRIEWRQFPIFGEESERAARAGWAAGRQGRFWEFHDVVYGEERRKNSGAFAQEKVEAMAREAGVTDLERFRADMASDAAETAIGTDMDEGYALGVSSTPAFLVNGTPVLGAQPTEVFAELVEEQERRAAGQ
ncbi:thioredoxin domain-containing protein [Streptomyces sp. TRM 70351]|uniref:DsbA family protein n=1 Tax=Streptomyces sp. TRM 70351 TaxID=3116552 RepID=UPI002E7BF3C7|nr:thioredoxin domain-containing protein [Streptomyces sp. TRM 70351]MEE1929533.1 thioredoxin domain-containing protein [Streptomyces sp. TRM 70351]